MGHFELGGPAPAGLIQPRSQVRVTPKGTGRVSDTFGIYVEGVVEVEKIKKTKKKKGVIS
jgi:hypothetical protein